MPDKTINNDILKLTTNVKPIISTKFIIDKEYEIIKINSKDHIIFKNNNDKNIYTIYIYIMIVMIAPEKYKQYEFTDNIDKNIRGFILAVDNKEAIEAYLQIYQDAKCNTNTNYYQMLTHKPQALNYPII